MTKKYIEDYFCTPEGQEEIRNLIGVEHCTLEQLARVFGIAPSTLTKWAKKHSEISDALRTGIIVRNEMIEHSLYDMCFAHKKVKKFIEQDPKDRNKILKVTIQEEDVDPDINAIQFVLTNQSKDKWKRKQELSFDPDSDLPKIIVDDVGMFTHRSSNDTPQTEKTPETPVSKQSKAKKKKLLKQLEDY